MIITTIEAIRRYIPKIAPEVKFIDFEPYITSANDWIKRDILGSTLYDKIDNGIISDEILLRYTEDNIVHQAYDTAIPYLDLIHTSSGFGVVNDANRAPASKARVDALQNQVKMQLGIKTDWLIDYLEDTAAYHTDWKSSPAYSLLSDCLIITARELKRLVSFSGNRNDFLMIKPVIISITTLLLAPQVSSSYITELIEKQKAGTLTAADLKILPSLKQSLANYVIEKDWFGKRLLEDAVSMMDKSLADYPTYRDSEEKALKDDPGFENTQENPMFIFKGGM